MLNLNNNILYILDRKNINNFIDSIYDLWCDSKKDFLVLHSYTLIQSFRNYFIMDKNYKIFLITIYNLIKDKGNDNEYLQFLLQLLIVLEENALNRFIRLDYIDINRDLSSNIVSGLMLANLIKKFD